MNTNYKLIAGVDEAGRGPLAGPVTAAAVILDPDHPIEGVTDSKKLTARKRELLFDQIIEHSLAFAISRAEVEEIDRINILQASLLAMHRAVDALSIKPNLVMVDGNQQPKWDYPTECIIKGDALIQSIGAASILAKVSRDREMLEMDKRYPQYGFAKHKGYPTKAHVAALQEHGACEIHRRSFAPVRDILVPV